MEDRQDVEQDPGYCSSKSMSAVSSEPRRVSIVIRG